MLNRPPRRSRRGGFLLRGVRGCWNPVGQQAGHDVESPSSCLSSLGRIGGQPGVCATANSLLFASIDGFRGEAMIRHDAITPGVLSQTPALDLDEDEHRATAHDQIDLDSRGADVARDDAISSRFEKSGGARFTFTPQFLSSIRHGSIRREGSARGGRVG